MNSTRAKWWLGGLCLLILAIGVEILRGQSPVLKTPLSPVVLNAIANEVSGQMAFNNLVQVGGAPWVRDPREFADTFYEAQIHSAGGKELFDRPGVPVQ